MAKSLDGLEKSVWKIKPKKTLPHDDDKDGEKTKTVVEGEYTEVEFAIALSEEENVQSVNAPQTTEAKNHISLAVRSVEEDEYSDDVELSPIVPSISEAPFTVLAPIVTEANDKEEEAEDDEELEIPDTGAHLGGDDNDDDEDEFFIQHTPSTTVKGTSINEPHQGERSSERNQQTYTDNGKGLAEDNLAILYKPEGELIIPEVTYTLTLFTPPISKPNSINPYPYLLLLHPYLQLFSLTFF
ncbi:hypothetical protein L6452_02571 [Arctium lappa]|uniref:Uncharacterized protein n=1 Tax=Arctium lappa TaxID=4217 RepID=A0ACB9FJS4_ARCLA|nr:hypothetical protein L6452_02571 [Arctium lappa]